MPINTTATTTLSLNWSQIDQPNNNQYQIVDVGSVLNQFVYISGTGLSGVNCLFHDYKTLPSGGTHSFDLQNLTRSALNGNISTAFSGVSASVKSFIIKNNMTSIGANIRVSATGANPWTAPFGGSGGFLVYPSGGWSISAPLAGYPVSSGAKNFQVYDIGGSGTIYEIAVIGTSG